MILPIEMHVTPLHACNDYRHDEHVWAYKSAVVFPRAKARDELEKSLVAQWRATPKDQRGSLKELLKRELKLPDDHWYLN